MEPLISTNDCTLDLNSGKLTNLQSLHASHNELTGLIDLSFADKLQTVSLGDNKELQTFPTISDQATALENIYLKDTGIKSMPAGFKDKHQRLKECEIYDHLLTGKEAVNQFLDGSLTGDGYEFTPSIKETKAFFDGQESVKYTTASSLDEARKDLGIDTAEKVISAKKTVDGKDYFYVFAGTTKGKDYV